MHIIKGPAEVARQATLPFRETRMNKGVRPTIKSKPPSTGALHKAESTDLLMSFQQLDLELPLYDSAQTVFDATYEVSSLLAERPADAAVHHEAVPSHFDDLSIEHVAQIHAKLLYRQLEQLFYARNIQGDSRREVLDWIYQPSEVAHVRADGTVTTIRSVFIPFTFEACCSFEQIDAYQLRDAITRRIDSLRGSRTLLARPTETDLQ